MIGPLFRRFSDCANDRWAHTRSVFAGPAELKWGTKHVDQGIAAAAPGLARPGRRPRGRLGGTHARGAGHSFGIGGDQEVGSLYQEDGFKVAGNDLFLTDAFGNPDRSIVLHSITPTLTISSIAGDPFSLGSFDSLCLLEGGSGCPNNIGVQGVLSGGGSTVSTLVSSDAGWATASVFASLVLTELTISRVGPNNNVIDNIVLNVIPLPAALPLLATALAGLGLAWRRAQRVGA